MNRKKLINILSSVLFLLSLLVFALTLGPSLLSEIKYQYNVYRGIKYKIAKDSPEENIDNSVLSDGVDTNSVVYMEPVDKNFSLVIEKIGLNAPIIPNVPVSNHASYMEALKYGIAHADGTAAPGETGNMTLFAHSSLDFWEMGQYANVFNLLRKLVIGDRVVVYYQGHSYVYEVFYKGVVKGWNTEPLTSTYDAPVVTLITCDPPGTTANRLVVKAYRIN